MSKIQPNRLCTRSVEFRAVESADSDASSDGRTLEGYAAVFNQDTEINGWEGTFKERMSPGAFKKTLSDRKPVMQFDHGHDSRVGSIPIGAFTELREDENGLYCEARLFDNPVVEPVRQAIEGGAISGMSFKFQVVRDEWSDKDGKSVRGEDLGRLLYEPGERGPLQRNIKEVKLFEAGPVVFPAYEQTSVGVRSTEADREKLIADYRKTMVEPSDEVEEERADSPPLKEKAPAKKPAADSLTLDTKAQAQAALADLKKNPDDYTPGQAAQIKAAAKKFGLVGPTPDGDDEKSASVDGAVREDTPSNDNPEDAALSGTSHRDHAAKETKRAKPEPVTRKAECKMNMEELKARKAEIAKRMTEIGTEYRDAALPTDEQGEWDGLETELRDVEAQVSAIEARTERLKGLAAAPKNVERGSDRGTPAVHIKQDDIYDLGELRSMAYNGDDFLAKVTDNAKRAIDGASYGVKGKETAQERAAELLDDVDNDSRDLAKRMLLTGAPEYARAFGKIMKHGNDAMCTNEERQALIRAQALGTNSGGGYAVPFQLDPTVILTNAGTVNPIRQMARVETIVGKQWQGVTSAGTTVTRGAEAATAPDSSFTLAQPVVSTNRVQGFVPFSIEIDLSWSALQREITNVLVDAKAREEDSFITGDGTGVNPEGIFGVATSDFTTAGSSHTFVLADLYNYVAALPVRWEDNASFLAHKAIYNLIRQFDTAGGAALWAHLGDGTPARLLDFPTFRTSASASALATTAKIAMFGDFKQFLIVDRIGMSVELVPHLFDATAPTGLLPTGQRGVYAVWMNNSKVLVPSAFKRLVVN